MHVYVYLKKDVEKLGMAGQVVKVARGYAHNFLVPQKLGVQINENEIEHYKKLSEKVVVAKEVFESKVAMMAERLKSVKVTITRKVHNGDRLYGSIGAEEVLPLLTELGFKVSKKQIDFPKVVKTIGEHPVSVKLTTKHIPIFTLKVVPEKG